VRKIWRLKQYSTISAAALTRHINAGQREQCQQQQQNSTTAEQWLIAKALVEHTPIKEATQFEVVNCFQALEVLDPSNVDRGPR
ncbi:hypothetical protein Ancab_001700, partial [Ancistrocladus abbreviatus]